MAFTLDFSNTADAQLDQLEKVKSKRLKKVRRVLGYLETNPRHPSLQTHEFTSMTGPKGEKVFEAYVENKTPGACRIFFCYPAGMRNTIWIIAITPHP